jgi:hypothetical protein
MKHRLRVNVESPCTRQAHRTLSSVRYFRSLRLWPTLILNWASLWVAITGIYVARLDEIKAAPSKVSFSQSASSVEAYDFVEVEVRVEGPNVQNPFTDSAVSGHFQRIGSDPVSVDGFCDSDSGSVYRIRFMPTQAGDYSYEVRYRQGDFEQIRKGSFQVKQGKRRGIVRVDRDYPWHFIWEGTGEHYFWNGTTTYWLLGWDEETIRNSIDRLHSLKVNRLRVALNARVKDGRDWFENVFATDKFVFRLNPWVAQRPDSIEDPGFDVTRFNISHWQKLDRLLHQAREKDMIISIIFYLDANKPGMDPFGRARRGEEQEQRYYRYAAARFAAFSNIMWDLSNEYRYVGTESWADQMGARMKVWDPYHHLASIHGYSDFRFRRSDWADFAMYQQWDEAGGYQFMVNNRVIQACTGRRIPQINEEYGYEDHYPTWEGARKAPARSADNRRRLAWELYMAGGYQTTGERADRGTGWGPDSGGGWVNGRGDEMMVMLKGYGYIVDFFKSFEWWKTEPHNELVNNWTFCLADPGRQYAVYLPSGGNVTIRLEPGKYRASWFNPRTGIAQAIESAQGAEWTSPSTPDKEDWALLLQKESSN